MVQVKETHGFTFYPNRCPQIAAKFPILDFPVIYSMGIGDDQCLACFIHEMVAIYIVDIEGNVF